MMRAAYAVLSDARHSAWPGVRDRALAHAGRRVWVGAAALSAVATVALVGGVTGLIRERGHRLRIALPAAAWGPVSRAMGKDDPSYMVSRIGAGFSVRNPRQRLAARFSTAGVIVRSSALVVEI